MDITLLYRSQSFKCREYLLLCQTAFSLLWVKVIYSILLLISLATSPSYSIQFPRYFNFLTCSIALSLHFNIRGESDVAMLFVLLTFTTNPTFSALSSLASISRCSHCFASLRRTISSAIRDLLAANLHFTAWRLLWNIIHYNDKEKWG